ncbi:bifunctional acyl-ACP--phospholipid O-acyltransferase/long-chain-fatty-acid--ACP ligase [Oxalobacteraceae bacterium R-40]|uniref:Bifunctional acyl-ACP--phospholipid O-acyltransferase/long-chain-fatty-acid--ACP ligase n=1 Tax=Keguizhuia sedimenti TaxID=3064264 RepID=A0ABU1BS49_9BURK|nr:bifunctional acyl-ACP--phospholipid O-acyltransferase/long-chain-fatty-acid--ACP ligase [Oxalobacteraceae bacterium R-40]
MFLKILKPVLRVFVRYAFRLELKGTQHVVGHEKTLIIANHESFLDAVLLWLYLPVDATFVAHTQIGKHPVMKHLLNLVPHFTVDVNNPMALKQIVTLVNKGVPVVIFPEGRLTTTGALMKVYDGTAFVATKTAATVVPIRLEGASRTYLSRVGGLYPRQLFPKLYMTVLPARVLPMPEGQTAKQRRIRSGNAMRRLMQEMLVLTRRRHTLYSAFLESVELFGKKYSIAEDVRLVEQSYGDILKSALGVSRLIRGISQPGERIGVLMPNATSTLAMILGFSAAGRVPAMLNYTAGKDGLQAACIAAQIKTILTSRIFVQKANLDPILSALSDIELVYAEDLKERLGLFDKIWIAAHMNMPRRALVPQSATDAAVVLFTSGSEGKPKGVVHSHDSILSNIAQVRAVADFMPSDKFLVALPLFHSFGFTCGALLPLMAGCKIFLYPSPLHYRIIPEIVYDRNCTVLFGTSTFLGKYGETAHQYDFGRLRYVIAGAEKLSDKVSQLWKDRFGIRILEGYGSTECAPVIAVNTPMAAKPGSAGQFLPCIEAHLEPVPGIEQGGALSVRGPNTMLGYFYVDNPGVLTPHTDEYGAYATGDIVSVDADGFVAIQGRIKRFAKIAGEMVSLESVEQLAAATMPDARHAAIAVPHEGKGEALVLFTTSRVVTREALNAKAKQIGLPELAVPRTVRLVQELPVLGTGKTDYQTLKLMLTEKNTEGELHAA